MAIDISSISMGKTTNRKYHSTKRCADKKKIDRSMKQQKNNLVNGNKIHYHFLAPKHILQPRH